MTLPSTMLIGRAGGDQDALPEFPAMELRAPAAVPPMVSPEEADQ